MDILFSYMPGVKMVSHLEPYEVETVGSVTYTRYTDGKVQPLNHGKPCGPAKEVPVMIIRKTVDGSITRTEKACDLWANRASAKYIPINSSFDVGLKTFQ